jgi:hypothetical protein
MVPNLNEPCSVDRTQPLAILVIIADALQRSRDHAKARLDIVVDQQVPHIVKPVDALLEPIEVIKLQNDYRVAWTAEIAKREGQRLFENGT